MAISGKSSLPLGTADKIRPYDPDTQEMVRAAMSSAKPLYAMAYPLPGSDDSSIDIVMEQPEQLFHGGTDY